MIYQIGNMGGYPFTIAEKFRKNGIEAINIVLEDGDEAGVTDKSGKKVLSRRNLKYDLALNNKKDSKFLKLFNRIKLVYDIIKNGKIVHYHSGTILPFFIDTYLFKIFKIPMFVSWGGGDARIIEMAISDNPYFYRFEETIKDNKIKSKFKILAKNNVMVATDPEMEVYCKNYFKNIYRFRVPINTNNIEKFKKSQQNLIPMILHIATHPIPRGSIHVENAVQRLKVKGYQFEYKFLTNLTQEEVYKEISKCDIFVDELRTGSHGVVALEACILEKPVLTYIKKSITNQFPRELPFVNTNPDTIYDNLKYLLLNPEKRVEIGKKSREYVEKYHDKNVVVDDMIKLYREVGADI